MECHKLDMRIARILTQVEAGPSFQSHVAALQEWQTLREKQEAAQAEVNVLEGIATWFSVNLPEAENNPQLSILLHELKSKKNGQLHW